MTIAGADLKACRFEGARGLDQLRLEGAGFAETPSGWRYWRWRGWRLPILWARRQVIAEEHEWRAERPGATGWYGPKLQPTRHELDRSGGRPGPDQIAEIYRALRKGREDNKDTPGAADFYYGEMEMRRHSTTNPRAERAIVWVCWLTSGYALRAWRAIAILALVILVCAALFDQGGLKDPDKAALRVNSVAPNGGVVLTRAPAAPPDFLDAATFSLGTATALPGVAPERLLTQWAALLRIGLRVLGPVLIGLALLSIRGRVKR